MPSIKSRFVVASTLLMLLGAAAEQARADKTGREIYKYTLRGTALIMMPDSLGSGWIIDLDDKLIVTNYHVVGHSSKALVFFPLYDKEGNVLSERSAYKDEDGYRCRVIYVDKAKDLAIIQVRDRLPENVNALKLAGSSVQPGDRVHSLGNPGASGGLFVYSSGTVRAVYNKKWNWRIGREPIELAARVVETQTPINPGDSGGPVVNDDGELIGVNSHGREVSGGKTVRLMTHHIDVSEVRKFLKDADRFREPKTAADFTLKGERLVDAGKYDDAVAALTEAIKLDPKHSAAYRHRSHAFCYKGDHDTAVLDCDEAIRLDRNDHEAYECRGLAYRRKGDIERAIKDYSKAIQIKPDFALAYNNRGFAYYLQGDNTRALADFERAVKHDARFAVAYQNQAQALIKLKRYTDAVAASDAALKINPFLARSFENRGLALRYLRKYDDAIQNYNVAIELFPKDASFHVDRGLALTWKNQWQQAVNEYDAALKINPNYARAIYYKGSAFEVANNIDKANEYYEKVMRLDPKGLGKNLERHHSCYLKIVNNSKEKIRVYVHIDAHDKDKGWGWYPTELGGASIWIDVDPESTVKTLAWQKWNVNGRRIRIRAVGLNSNSKWDRDKDKDIWLCPREGYYARDKITRTYTFR